MMKVRDLLEQDIDIDVVDNVCEELWIAFCGPMKLTKEGMKKFGDVLDFPVSLVNGNVAIIDVDDESEGTWEHKLDLAKEMFDSMAGYCTSEEYDKWFEEVR